MDRVNLPDRRAVERMMTARGTSTRGRWRLLASTAVGVVCLLAGSLPSAAQSADHDHSHDSDEVDVLTATREEVRQALARLDERYAEQRQVVEQAEQTAREAADEVERAEARVALAEHEVEQARETVARYAVEAYMRPPAQDSLRVLSVTQADDAAYASSVIEIMTEERYRVVDVLVGKRVAADKERAKAKQASQRAKEAASAAQSELVSLDRIRAQQRELAASLDDRLDAALAESAALAAVDEEMSEELAAQELALRDAGPASAPSAAPVADRPSPPTTRPSATTTRPPTTRPPSGGGSGTTVPPSSGSGIVTWADVTSVGGIWVHTSIANNLRNLLNAATAAGFNLDGGGYRDPASQIETRRNNCGPTYYDIYEKPSSQCSPPTARPGRSMHEQGRAIDFRSNGSLITSRSNPAFVWLKNNAARYGFYNLPSEPWHWSTNGN